MALKARVVVFKLTHPLDKYLRTDRIPHIWCSGCGIGPALAALFRALDKLDIPIEKTIFVSGIGCTGRVAGYWRGDGLHVTHGRPIPVALAIKLVRPDLNVIVFSGDGDLATIGGNHLIHAARRNHDLLVVLINNYNYGMTGGQYGATTPIGARTSSSPYGHIERPFNIPYLVAGAGAPYVARWTSLHVHRLYETFVDALQKRGFRLIEVIAQCPTNFGRRNRMPDAMDMLEYFRKNSVIWNNAPLHEVGLDRPDGKIIVGKFLDVTDKVPTYEERYLALLQKLGAKLRAKVIGEHVEIDPMKFLEEFRKPNFYSK